MKATIVVPSNRPKQLEVWLEAWRVLCIDHHAIIVQDLEEKTVVSSKDVLIYDRADIKRDFEDYSWIFPTGTDCIRSYGIWKAYEQQPDMIITMDDDCMPAYDDAPRVDGPAEYFAYEHWSRLTERVDVLAWGNTLTDAKARGVPYYNTKRTLPIGVNIGLWQGAMDYDAPTQLSVQHPSMQRSHTFRMGEYAPMCGMNLAWKTELTPLMYFLLMGQPTYPYDRFGDIWCGIFAKKVLDRLGYAMRCGKPYVRHDRKSNVWANLRREAPGLEVNETLWQLVDDVMLTQTDVVSCYRELVEKVDTRGAYWERLREAQLLWLELFG